MNENVIAIIGDIVDSRKIKERELFQEVLYTSLDNLNQIFKPYMKTKMEISSGDSFQGLFKDLENSFLYLRMLEFMIYPIKLRAGIGIGPLNININTFYANSNQLDGMAYHLAKDAIDEVSPRGQQCIRIKTKEQSDQVDALNLMLTMYHELKYSGTPQQFLIAYINEVLTPITFNGFEQYEFNVKEYFDKYEYKSKLPLLLRVDTKELSTFRHSKNFIINNDLVFENNTFKDREYRSLPLEPNLFVTRGIQQIVADIIKTTRQNVSKSYSAYVSKERMYTVHIVNHMKEVGI